MLAIVNTFGIQFVKRMVSALLSRYPLLSKKCGHMSETCLILLSPDDQWSQGIIERLIPGIEAIHCRSLKDAAEVMVQRRVWGCLADFRTIIVGGHAEERFLEMLHGKFPEAQLWLATPQLCPEPIDRFSACHPVVRLTVHASELVCDAINNRRQAEVEAPFVAAAANPAPPATESVTSLTGLTRRFETNTPKAKSMLADLEIAAKHDVTILLIGETGAGKTFLSRLIHEVSPRRNEPFLTVACGAGLEASVTRGASTSAWRRLLMASLTSSGVLTVKRTTG